MSTTMAAIAMIAALLLETTTQQLVQVVNQPLAVESVAQIPRSERFKALGVSLNVDDLQASQNCENARI